MIKWNKRKGEFIDEEEKETRVELKLITGGKDSGGSGNWLQDLEEGTVFFVQDRKGTDFVLGMFRITHKDGPVVALDGPATQGQRIYVNPIRFCLRYDKYYVAGVIKPEEQEETENSDVEGDRVPGDGSKSPEDLA